MSDTEMRYVLHHTPYVGVVRRVYAVFALVEDDEYHPLAITPKLVPVFLTLTGCSWPVIIKSMGRLIKDGCIELLDKREESGAIEYRLLKPHVRDEDAYPFPELEAYILDKCAPLTHDQVKDVIMATVLANLFFCFGQVEAAQAAMIDARHTLDVAELTTLDSITETDTSDLLQELRQLGDVKAVLLRYAKNWDNVSQGV